MTSIEPDAAGTPAIQAAGEAHWQAPSDALPADVPAPGTPEEIDPLTPAKDEQVPAGYVPL